MKVGYTRVSSIDGSQETGLDTQVEIQKDMGLNVYFLNLKAVHQQIRDFS